MDPAPEGRVRPTGWQMPVGIMVVAGLLAYAVTDRLYADFPPLPWTAIPTVLLLAAVEFVAAYHTRRRIRRLPWTVPVEPLTAARLLALAKASVAVAVLVGGAFGGVALVLLDRLHAPGPRADVLVAGGTAAAALLLLVAGLALERACRVPG